MYKVTVLIFILLSVASKAEYLIQDDINTTKISLQVSKCNVIECVLYAHDILGDEKYFTEKVNNHHITYLVNIEDKEESKRLKQKYQPFFKNRIFKRKVLKDKKVLKDIDYEDFKYKKDLKVTTYTNHSIYDRPDEDRKKIAVTKDYNSIEIESCNEQDWCKLKYESGFIHFKDIENSDFKNKNDFKMVPLFDKTIIYDQPDDSRKKIGVIQGANPIYVDSCNNNNWCKLKYGFGFVHLKHVVSEEKIFPAVKEKVPNSTVVVEKTINKELLLKYTKALKYFKNKDYHTSYDLFEELFQDNINDVNINFYLGRSSFEIKKYNEAIQAYERVLFDKPNSSRAKYEMAKAYFLSRSYKSAKNTFLDLQDDENIPDVVLADVENYLKIIDSIISKHIYSGMLMLGVNYDSNVNSRSKYDEFNNVYIADFDIYIDFENTTEKVADYSHQEIAVFNYGYKLSDDHILKHDFMIFSKKMFNSDYKDYDVALLSYNPAFSVNHNDQLSVDYGLFVSDMWLGSALYLQSYGLFEKLSYKYDDRLTIKTHLKYQINSYKNDASGSKKSSYIEFDAGSNYMYNGKTTFTSSFVYTSETKMDSQTKGIGSQSIGLNLGGTYIYKPNITFSPLLRAKQTSYDDTDPLYLKKAKNTEFNLGFVSTYIYTHKWIVQGGVNYLYKDSNLPTSTYDKYMFNINIIRPF